MSVIKNPIPVTIDSTTTNKLEIKVPCIIQGYNVKQKFDEIFGNISEIETEVSSSAVRGIVAVQNGQAVIQGGFRVPNVKTLIYNSDEPPYDIAPSDYYLIFVNTDTDPQIMATLLNNALVGTVLYMKNSSNSIDDVRIQYFSDVSIAGYSSPIELESGECVQLILTNINNGVAYWEVIFKI